MEKNGNSIILNLSSETLPVSRAGNEPGVEMAVNHIDVVIFEENGDWKWHERVEGSETGNGKITLTAKRSRKWQHKVLGIPDCQQHSSGGNIRCQRFRSE